MSVLVSPEPIDLAAEFAAVGAAGAGGVASFTGLVRADDGVERRELEHYPQATEAALAALIAEASARWDLLAARIVHRVGPMRPGEAIVLVIAAAAHRQPALAACAFLIDRLKTDAPFWKKEVRGPAAGWVEPRASDAAAAAGWLA